MEIIKEFNYDEIGEVGLVLLIIGLALLIIGIIIDHAWCFVIGVPILAFGGIIFLAALVQLKTVIHFV